MARRRLIAVDLDGTMLDGTGGLTDRVIESVSAAAAAGHEVVVCTGRGYRECAWVLDRLPGVRYAVVAGGAIITDARTGKSVHRFVMDPGLVAGAVDVVHEFGHAALVLKDSSETGYDYLVLTGEHDHPIDPVTHWWFSNHEIEHRCGRTTDDDEHAHLTVRVGACADDQRCDALADALSVRLGERLTVHSFPAVVAPSHVSTTDTGGTYHVFEAFDAIAHKWTAIDWLKDRLGIPQEDTCAIGDQINDVTMIRGAGVGVAMQNAVESVRTIADRHTGHHHEFGAAQAIDHLASGRW